MSAAAPERILVVDDELGVREGCRKILSSEGFDVMTAGDGKAGLEQFLERGPFGVLLVDLQMPRMSGLELMREVRVRDEDMVCIIITAHATIDTAVEGTRQGAYSFIPKPFTADELAPVHQEWAGETGADAGAPNISLRKGNGASWSWQPSDRRAPRSSPA